MDTDLRSVDSVCSVDINHLPWRTRMDTDLRSVDSVCSVDKNHLPRRTRMDTDTFRGFCVFRGQKSSSTEDTDGH